MGETFIDKGFSDNIVENVLQNELFVGWLAGTFWQKFVHWREFLTKSSLSIKNSMQKIEIKFWGISVGNHSQLTKWSWRKILSKFCIYLILSSAKEKKTNGNLLVETETGRFPTKIFVNFSLSSSDVMCKIC